MTSLRDHLAHISLQLGSLLIGFGYFITASIPLTNQSFNMELITNGETNSTFINVGTNPD